QDESQHGLLGAARVRRLPDAHDARLVSQRLHGLTPLRIPILTSVNVSLFMLSYRRESAREQHCSLAHGTLAPSMPFLDNTSRRRARHSSATKDHRQYVQRTLSVYTGARGLLRALWRRLYPRNSARDHR